jgi:hypothetical protein
MQYPPDPSAGIVIPFGQTMTPAAVVVRSTARSIVAPLVIRSFGMALKRVNVPSRSETPMKIGPPPLRISVSAVIVKMPFESVVTAATAGSAFQPDVLGLKIRTGALGRLRQGKGSQCGVPNLGLRISF